MTYFSCPYSWHIWMNERRDRNHWYNANSQQYGNASCHIQYCIRYAIRKYNKLQELRTRFAHWWNLLLTNYVHIYRFSLMELHHSYDWSGGKKASVENMGGWITRVLELHYTKNKVKHGKTVGTFCAKNHTACHQVKACIFAALDGI